ncbi:MAG: PEGA domain-containing protein [Usitatibacter sp.]
MSTASTPVYANVAFLRIPRFSSRPVGEQASLKEQLESRARLAIESIPAADRAVLDAEDGLAIVLFGDAARALDVAQVVHAASIDSPLQAGLSYGPLALTSRGSDGRVLGDGLTAAAAAARFATPEKLLVTGDFAKALQRAHPARAAALATAGDFTDTRVRLHSFYTPDAKLGSVYRRRLLAYGAGGVTGILLLGIAGREAAKRLFPPLPAVVRLTVRPRGEIVVDGVSRGMAPPLHEIEVAAGKRVVQIRNPGYPPLEITLDLKPGERTTIAHTFTRPQTQPKPDFWRDFKKKLGS